MSGIKVGKQDWLGQPPTQCREVGLRPKFRLQLYSGVGGYEETIRSLNNYFKVEPLYNMGTQQSDFSISPGGPSFVSRPQQNTRFRTELTFSYSNMSLYRASQRQNQR